MTDVTLRIDGRPVAVPKGTKVIRAAELAGVAIPRFCDHPLLDPVAACRACIVEVPDAGNGRGMKPQPACALDAADNMVINTGVTSPVAAAAQQGMLEFLLINHPLDCPMCDKAGECPLQNQALADGRGESRYDGIKRSYPKPVALGERLLLDRERCVLCQRCTRFGDQISGDSLLSLVERGAASQIGMALGADQISYFAGNLTQICPVGALTSVDYRFQARPVDLASTATTCDNCAAGCALHVDVRSGQVRRRLAAWDPSVNEEWNCDKGRFGFRSSADRLTSPLIRVDGELRSASWPQALAAAAQGLTALRGRAGVLPGGHLTVENALAYAQFAQQVLGTESVDARARRGATAEEAGFLARQLRGGNAVTYDDLEQAHQVVLVGLEPEDECPMVFLRLRKATRRGATAVVTVAPAVSAGSRKLSARLVAAAPGGEVGAWSKVHLDADTIVLVGERASQVPGLLGAVEAGVAVAGARLAWVPRRAGELGAIMVGCLPGEGLSTDEMLTAAARGHIGLLIGGVDLDDLDDPEAGRAAVARARFVVSLEQRPSAVTELADVVLPVALLAEQAGTFLDWTCTARLVNPVLPVQPMTDRRVLAELARRMGHDLKLASLEQAREVAHHMLEAWAALPLSRIAGHTTSAAARGVPASGAVVATWRSLLSGSRCLEGANLTARPLAGVAGPDIFKAAGVTPGEVVLSGPDADLSVPLLLDPEAAAGVVCLPDAPWASGTPVRVRAAPGRPTEGGER